MARMFVLERVTIVSEDEKEVIIKCVSTYDMRQSTKVPKGQMNSQTAET